MPRPSGVHLRQHQCRPACRKPARCAVRRACLPLLEPCVMCVCFALLVCPCHLSSSVGKGNARPVRRAGCTALAVVVLHRGARWSAAPAASTTVPKWAHDMSNTPWTCPVCLPPRAALLAWCSAQRSRTCDERKLHPALCVDAAAPSTAWPLSVHAPREVPPRQGVHSPLTAWMPASCAWGA